METTVKPAGWRRKSARGRGQALLDFGAGDGENIQAGAALGFVGMFDGGDDLGGRGRRPGRRRSRPASNSSRLAAVSLGEAVTMRLISWASLLCVLSRPSLNF